MAKTADYGLKPKEIEDKILNHDTYIATPKFNKLTKKNFQERLK